MRRRWALGLVVSWLGLSLALVSVMSGSGFLGWLLLRQPILASVGVQVLVQFLLTCQAILRGLWPLAASLPAGWLSAGVNGYLITSLGIVCLWVWLAFGRQQWRTGPA
jgi:hypothetical protein